MTWKNYGLWNHSRKKRRRRKKGLLSEREFALEWEIVRIMREKGILKYEPPEKVQRDEGSESSLTEQGEVHTVRQIDWTQGEL